MELKLISKAFSKKEHASFNQTRMELKRTFENEPAEGMPTFNQTRMELKRR